MKVWWITDKKGAVLGLLTRAFNAPKIIRFMYEPRCEFVMEDNGASLMTFRVSDPKFPKWDDFVTAKGMDVPNTGELVVWWLTDASRRFMGIVPDSVDLLGYLRLSYIEDEAAVVVARHEEDDLRLFTVRYNGQPEKWVDIRAEKVKFRV